MSGFRDIALHLACRIAGQEWIIDNGPTDAITKVGDLLEQALPLANPKRAFCDVLSEFPREPIPAGCGYISRGPPHERIQRYWH